MSTTTNIIDQLFLELSQFTNATTAKELHYERELERILQEPHKDSMTDAMKMKSLLHCIRVLGIRMGWRYWRIERRCIRNPELVLFWAKQCRSEAEELYYNGFGDEGTLAVMRHWADKLEESYANYTAK